MSKLKKLSELAPGEKLIVPYVSSCEPNWDYDRPDGWGTYTHRIIVKVYTASEMLDIQDSSIFLALEGGDFELDGEIWCDELGKVLSKDNIIKIAKESKKNIKEFIKDLQDEVFYACLDWYRKNLTVDDDEDAYNMDGINDDALEFIIYDQEGSGIEGVEEVEEVED